MPSRLVGEHDAEDVTQATFLLLAQKADRLDPRDSIGGWLCGVARRLSLHARAGTAAFASGNAGRGNFGNFGRLGSLGDPRKGWHPSADPLAEIVRRDLKRLLDTELDRLPAKYRAPIVLCDLEGLTHEEAAARAGMPGGLAVPTLGKSPNTFTTKAFQPWLGGGRCPLAGGDGLFPRGSPGRSESSRRLHRYAWRWPRSARPLTVTKASTVSSAVSRTATKAFLRRPNSNVRRKLRSTWRIGSARLIRDAIGPAGGLRRNA